MPKALPEIAREIQSAQTTVWLAGWYFSPDYCLRRDRTQTLRDLLGAAAECGVDVRLPAWGGAPLPLFHPDRREAQQAAQALERDTRIRVALDSKGDRSIATMRSSPSSTAASPSSGASISPHTAAIASTRTSIRRATRSVGMTRSHGFAARRSPTSLPTFACAGTRSRARSCPTQRACPRRGRRAPGRTNDPREDLRTTTPRRVHDPRLVDG